MANRRLADEQLSRRILLHGGEPRVGRAADREVSGGPAAVARDPAAVARAGAGSGWLPQPAIEQVADMLGMANIRVLEVATFYTMFLL